MKNNSLGLIRLLTINLSSYRIQLVRLSFFLSILYLFYFVQEYIVFQSFDGFLLILFFLFLFIGLSIIVFKFNRAYVHTMRTVSLLLIAFITVYYHLHYGVETGFFLFYFFNLLSMPYLISFKAEEKNIL